MTERLHDLLVREADDLDIPAPPAADVVRRGRGLRTRRRVALGAVALTTAAVVAAGGIVVGDALGGSGSSGRDDDLAPAAALEGWAVASGSSVHLGNGERAEVDGTVKSLYYTSEGVLARTGKEAFTDAPDSRYSLIADDGAVTDFDLDLGDRVPSTDPALPYFAYAEPTADPQRWQVVLRDVRTGEVDRRIPITGAFTWGGWVAPPVALSGDHVYVAMDRATLDVDWRDRTVTTSDVLHRSFFPTVAGGRMLDDMVAPYGVRDARSGQRLLRLPGGEETVPSLSPDGAHVMVSGYRTCTEDGECTWDDPTLDLYDVATGDSVPFDTAGILDLGWTPNGWLIAVRAKRVDVCEPTTGDCKSTPVDVGGKDLRVGGSLYES